MSSFTKEGSLADFQQLIDNLYRTVDDQLFSLFQLISITSRFTMRVVKGVRKDDREMVVSNLTRAFSWLMTLANRLHIDVSDVMWKRFPGVCSYCGQSPCVCREHRVTKRVRMKEDMLKKPKTLDTAQKKMNEIYPAGARTLAHAGIHLAEEMGEITEAIYRYYSNPTPAVYEEVKMEIADYASVIFNVANSADINLSEELDKRYRNGCYECHACPCKCEPAKVATIAT